MTQRYRVAPSGVCTSRSIGAPGRTINRVRHTTINVCGDAARVGGDGQRVGRASTPPHRHRAQPKWLNSLVRLGYPISPGSLPERVNFLQLRWVRRSVSGAEPFPGGLQGLGRHPGGTRPEDDRHDLGEASAGREE